MKWSKDKYIDKIGLRYRNLYYALPIVLFIIIFNLWRIQIFFFGETIQNQIYSQADKADTLLVDLKKMTDFDWDKVYVFDNNVPKREMEKILHFIPDVRGVEQSFIFTKKDKYISSEELYFRYGTERDIDIILDSGKPYMSFSVDSAKFKLTKDFNTAVYSLKPVY